MHKNIILSKRYILYNFTLIVEYNIITGIYKGKNNF